MLLDVVMGFLAAAPASWQPEYLGPLDGVRLRMMRLARAAVIALSLLTLLNEGLLTTKDRKLWWALHALLFGAVGMPCLLVAAAVGFLPLKYLLGLPAQAALLGVVVACFLSCKRGSVSEFWGWLLVALSMSAGLLMGLYAFDGPFFSPDFLGEYNDWNRRFSRLGHAYLIVLGLICILQGASDLGTRHGRSSPPKLDWSCGNGADRSCNLARSSTDLGRCGTQLASNTSRAGACIGSPRHRHVYLATIQPEVGTSGLPVCSSSWQPARRTESL